MSSVAAQPVQPEQPVGITAPMLTQPQAIRRSPDEVYTHRLALAAAVKKFVRKKPNLRIIVEGKKYPLAAVWIFCAACDGTTAMITKTEELINDERLEMGYLSIAHAIDATGRIQSGAEATCLCAEPDWQGKPSFQIRSMSETRSVSKVLSILYKDVMVLAGFEPTPAEEMGAGSGGKRGREITTPCYECGANKVTKKRGLTMRKQWGKELCIDCEKKIKQDHADKITAPLNDPRQVSEFIATAKQRKASGGQPVVALLDTEKEDIA
jgi:hypothetical protein